MTVPNVPPTPPRSVVATALLLILGLLLLAPGLCAVLFIKEYASSPYPTPSGFIPLWIISFIISAAGIALIVYAFRR